MKGSSFFFKKTDGDSDENAPAISQREASPGDGILFRSKQLKCAICMESIIEAGEPSGCDHTRSFCFACLRQWAIASCNACPLCKKRFTRIIRRKLGRRRQSTSVVEVVEVAHRNQKAENDEDFPFDPAAFLTQDDEGGDGFDPLSFSSSEEENNDIEERAWDYKLDGFVVEDDFVEYEEGNDEFEYEPVLPDSQTPPRRRGHGRRRKRALARNGRSQLFLVSDESSDDDLDFRAHRKRRGHGRQRESQSRTSQATRRTSRPSDLSPVIIFSSEDEALEYAIKESLKETKTEKSKKRRKSRSSNAALEEEDEDLRRALSESLKKVDEGGERARNREDYRKARKKPNNENGNEKDEALERALKESLRDIENQQLSSQEERDFKEGRKKSQGRGADGKSCKRSRQEITYDKALHQRQKQAEGKTRSRERRMKRVAAETDEDGWITAKRSSSSAQQVLSKVPSHPKLAHQETSPIVLLSPEPCGVNGDAIDEGHRERRRKRLQRNPAYRASLVRSPSSPTICFSPDNLKERAVCPNDPSPASCDRKLKPGEVLSPEKSPDPFCSFKFTGNPQSQLAKPSFGSNHTDNLSRRKKRVHHKERRC